MSLMQIPRRVDYGLRAVIYQVSACVNKIGLRTYCTARDTARTTSRENPPIHAAWLDDIPLRDSKGNSPEMLRSLS